jgi:hypothetical protein
MSKKFDWYEKRNVSWAFWKYDDGSLNMETVNAIILLDIREELKTLNRVFACQNFLQVPKVLRDIRRNTTKKPKKKPA